MPHRDPVTPEMREAVFARDRLIVSRFMAALGQAVTWRRDRLMTPHGGVACPAIVIDYDNEMWACWGRWTLDHIKSGMRLGRRAPSDAFHLISLCEGHTENGMRHGRIWNTSHRPEIRAYLEQVNKEPQ